MGGLYLKQITACFVWLNQYRQNQWKHNNSKSVLDRTENPSTNCSCPPEYKGQFCEQCASGYTRSIPNEGPYVTCVPCQCSGGSNKCHPETGECMDYQHTTTGTELQLAMAALRFEILAAMYSSTVLTVLHCRLSVVLSSFWNQAKASDQVWFFVAVSCTVFQDSGQPGESSQRKQGPFLQLSTVSSKKQQRYWLTRVQVCRSWKGRSQNLGV